MVKRSFSVLLVQLIGLLLCLSLNAKTQNLNGSHTVVSADGQYLLNVFYTESRTWVKAQRTSDMAVVAQWQISDFRPDSIEFAPNDSSRLLIANNKKIFVYQLSERGNERVFEKQVDPGKNLVNVTFNAEGDSVVWATESVISKTTIGAEIETRLASIQSSQGRIKAVVPLNDDQYIVLLEDDTIIHIYSRSNTIFSKELKGHQRPVIRAQTPGGKRLFSVDDHQELIIWDLESYNIIKRLQLGDLENPSGIEGVSLNNRKTDLLVKTESDPDGFGKRYQISDLNKGMVNPSRVAVSVTDSGNVFESAARLDTSSPTIDRDRLPGSFSGFDEPSREDVRRNSYYDLAKIEADNENYEAALNFIKRVPEDDPEYRLSRELRKDVLEQIEIKNSLSGAVDQYKTGNYKSAKIILENILARRPDQKTAKRYLKLTEKKLSPPWLSVLGVIFLIIIIVAVAVLVVWIFKPEWLRAILPARKKTKEEETTEEKEPARPKKDKAYHQRKAFILKLDETRQLLKKAISLDSDGKYKDKWLEMSAILNDIENRAKKNDKYLPGLSRQLEKIQEKIIKLVPAVKPIQSKSETENPKSAKALPGEEPKQEKSSSDSSKKKRKLSPYQILGVTDDATPAEIKRAYRIKLKEYHPDKHSSSDFKWVKEEADRMTRLIQDAYDSLSGK